MDFVTVSTGLILPYWMGLPIRYIQPINKYRKTGKETVVHVKKRKEKRANLETPKVDLKLTLK